MVYLEACGNIDFVRKLSDSLKNTYICSLHFEEHMFVCTARNHRKKTVIPVLLLPIKGRRLIHTQTDPKNLYFTLCSSRFY